LAAAFGLNTPKTRKTNILENSLIITGIAKFPDFLFLAVSKRITGI